MYPECFKATIDEFEEGDIVVIGNSFSLRGRKVLLNVTEGGILRVVSPQRAWTQEGKSPNWDLRLWTSEDDPHFEINLMVLILLKKEEWGAHLHCDVSRTDVILVKPGKLTEEQLAAYIKQL